MRPRRGILAAAALSWCLAVIPMIASVFKLTGGERGTQALGAIFMAVFAAPISLVLGLGFVPVHAVLKRLGRTSLKNYMMAGMVITSVLVGLLVINNGVGRSIGEEIASEDRWVLLVIAAVGAAAGAAFWLGAVWRSQDDPR